MRGYRSTPLIMLLVTVATASAGQAADAAPDAAAKPKMICRAERETGSFVKVQRTCMTKAQADRLADRSREEIDRIDRNSVEGTIRGATDAGPAAVGALNAGGQGMGLLYQNPPGQ